MYDQEKIIKKLASFLRASTEDIGKILSKQKNLKATDNENFWYFHPRSGKKPKVVLVAHIDTVKDTGQRQYVYYKNKQIAADYKQDRSFERSDNRVGWSNFSIRIQYQ